MWRLSDHKERTGGAPGREVELLLGGTQQKDRAEIGRSDSFMVIRVDF